MTSEFSNRRIQIEESAIGSAIVSGDGNTIYVIQQTLEQHREEQRAENTDEVGPNPYKGLASFKESDADRYFGREVQIERLRQRFQHLWEQSQAPRFLPILGPSGCGKSSLARAGFIPELARQPLPGKEWMRVAVMVPGVHPLEALAGVLAKAATDDPLPVEKADEFERVLKKANDAGEYPGLRQIASLIPSIQDAPLIILVDQFEEVYSLCKDVEQRQAFINNLLHAASDLTRCVSVVITLRSDFLGETQRHQQLNQVIGSDQSVIVPAMTEDELRRAISEPAKQARHPLDEATIELLVKDTEGREGALPLLQFALSRIWSGLAEGKEPAVTYREMGGVGGALAGKAREIYETLNESKRAIAHRVFVGLVQLGEGTRDTRRRVKVNDLIASYDNSEEVRQVINQFSSSTVRLISLSDEDKNEFAEITHEALIQNWDLLGQWVEGNRDLLRQQRRIEADAKIWSQKSRSKDYLLKGLRLIEALDFQNKDTAKFPLTFLAKSYIDASLKERRISSIMRVTIFIVIFLGFMGFGLGTYAHQGRILLRWLSFRRSHLTGADLSGIYLDYPESDLSKAELSQANLERSNLTGVNFSSSNLRSANLSNSHMPDVVLLAANLEKAILTNSYVERGNLIGANLKYANLDKINLKFAILSQSNLQNASLKEAYMPNSRFQKSNLSGANLTKADLNSANLSASNLQNASFRKTYMPRANLEGADIRGCDFRGNRTITAEQIKLAINWQEAIYDQQFCEMLGLESCKTTLDD